MYQQQQQHERTAAVNNIVQLVIPSSDYSWQKEEGRKGGIWQMVDFCDLKYATWLETHNKFMLLL